ncbi:MAG TPA: nucleoside-diphosphate kinase [archaeon]|nr:nucleoside-diphosphate kinase [archaeon]
MAIQRSFVMLKPEAVRRQLVGEIVGRLEKAGLKLMAMKMVTPTAEKVKGFYPTDDDWLTRVGGKTIKGYEKLGIDLEKEMGTKDPLQLGKTIKSWLVKYISSGPVVAMVWEGNRARELIRKMVGNTEPFSAETGTVRGDLSFDSFENANREFRSLFNLIHASETEDEASHEIAYWFTESELQGYKTGTDLVWDELKKSVK